MSDLAGMSHYLKSIYEHPYGHLEESREASLTSMKDFFILLIYSDSERTPQVPDSAPTHSYVVYDKLITLRSRSHASRSTPVLIDSVTLLSFVSPLIPDFEDYPESR